MKNKKTKEKMKCPQCSKKMAKMIFNIGYDVEVNALHCKSCGMNRADEKGIEKALNIFHKKNAEKTASQTPPEPF